MKITLIELDGDVNEIDSSTVVSELLARRFKTPDTDPDTHADPAVPADVVQADDAAAGAAAQEAEAETADTWDYSPNVVPGVAAEGQDTVRRLLDGNPAGDLFVRFLAETTSWPSVRVHGIKRRGAQAGEALDYSRYLRLRKHGSQYGGFAYVYAVSGEVNPRRAYDTDEDLAELAPDAWRLETGHREYRVAIRIEDESTLQQALDLARDAYHAT